MEINRYLEEYKKHSTKEFFDWVSEGRTIEVRFLSDRTGAKFRDYSLIKDLGLHLKVETRFTSLYINDYETLKFILLYRLNGVPLTKLYNIFISVNPRRKVFTKTKNGLLRKTYYGGIAGTSHIQNVLCDIEHIGDREGNATEEMLEDCINGAKYLVKVLKINNYYINISGNGVHLWFKLETPIPIPIPNFIEFDDKVKYNLKEGKVHILIKTYNKFIEKLDKMIKDYNTHLKVDDGAKDIARIARPTGSWNVKARKVARAVGTVNKELQNNKYNNNLFTSVNPIKDIKTINYIKIKNKTKYHRYNYLSLREAPLVKLMLSGLLPSTLSRNHYLEQSLARLLRDNEIDLLKIQDIIADINAAQQKDIQIDPDYLDDEEAFNSATVNTYCFTCRIDLPYKIMEDIPEITKNTDDYIDSKRYQSLNNISETTLQTYALDIQAGTITNLFTLKTKIRNMVDNDIPRSDILLALRKAFYSEWDYFDRNKIILTILNKTRRRSK